MNLVILSGNLTADPEVRFTLKGQAVAEFTIAHNKDWTTESGEEKRRVAFVSCFIFGKRGEAFAKYHKKGSKALISGEWVQDTWDDKDTGKKRVRDRVQVQNWEFVGAREGGAESRYSRSTKGTPQASQAMPTPPATKDQPEDDDVPF